MSHLLITCQDRVLRLTLNRPDQNNLLTEPLCRDLLSTLRDAGRDRSVGAVLIEAAGPLFCGGLDLDEGLFPDAGEITETHERLFTFGLHYHKPIVAAVQGPCLGAGVGLVANAHVVVAAQGTQFALTEIRYGFWPFVTHRALALALGERRTVELSLTGRVFSVQEALSFGLVHEIAPPFEVDDRASSIARNLAVSSQETLRRGLDFVQQSREMSWATAGILASEMIARTQRSADFAEGVHAARDSRKPVWPSLSKT
jgi:enoyl-CoA hydratase/carnithine racemase